MKLVKNLIYIQALACFAFTALAHDGQHGIRDYRKDPRIKEVANDSVNLDAILRSMRSTFIELINETKKTPGQMNDLQQDIRNGTIEEWTYLPLIPRSLAWRDMSQTQKLLTARLVRAGLSSKGFAVASDIQMLDALDKEENDNLIMEKGTENYGIRIYGDPAGPNWFWRFHGHHLVLSFEVSKNKLSSVSPTVIGGLTRLTDAVKDGPGLELLSLIHKQGETLANSLNNEQRVKGFDNADPRHLVMINRMTLQNGRLRRIEPRGVMGNDLSPDQQKILYDIVYSYLHMYKPALAEVELSQMRRRGGVQAMDFKWSINPETKHSYFRVQGPTFILEFDTFRELGHYHTIYRNLINDNGSNVRDVLRDHYSNGHGHR